MRLSGPSAATAAFASTVVRPSACESTRRRGRRCRRACHCLPASKCQVDRKAGGRANSCCAGGQSFAADRHRAASCGDAAVLRRRCPSCSTRRPGRRPVRHYAAAAAAADGDALPAARVERRLPSAVDPSSPASTVGRHRFISNPDGRAFIVTAPRPLRLWPPAIAADGQRVPAAGSAATSAVTAAATPNAASARRLAAAAHHTPSAASRGRRRRCHLRLLHRTLWH